MLTVAARGLAQQQPPDTLPGFRANNVYENGAVDHVGLYSGDPSIVVPLGPEYPLGPGSTWQLKAYYSSNLWTMFEDPSFCPPRPNLTIKRAHVRGYPALGIGWTLELGYMHASQCGGGGSACSYTYISPDGGRHVAGSGNGGITTDGTQLRMACSPPGGYTSCTVESPDGTIQTFAHQYRAPLPFSGISPDFSDDPTASTVNRLGLSSVIDRFGATLLTVTYASNVSSSPDAWRVTAINLNGNPARAVTYTWGMETIGAGAPDPTWQVVRQIKFPSAAGADHSLLAFFDFDPNDPFIRRNGYDSSWLFPAECHPSSTTVQVPFLQGIRFADEASPSVTLASYGHQYFLPPVSQLDNRAGVLTRLTLPTGGTIDYAYSPSSANDNVGLPLDLESSGGGAPNAPDFDSSCDITFQSFWNANPVVVSRTVKSSLADPGSVTNYARDQYRPALVCLPSEPDANRVTRRVIVTEPTGNGTSRRATKYLFHVGLGSGDVSGIELERRYYADTNTGGIPVRTIVNCVEADNVADGSITHCGYLEPGGGSLQQYHMAGNVRRSREVTWYGANPTGGGNCSPGFSPPCVQTAHSAYNTDAKEYGTTTLASSISGSIRAISTNWTRTSLSPGWLLKLYDARTVTEGTSVVDQGFEFDAQGFLKGSFTYDSARQRAAFTCRYSDGVGNVAREFSATASIFPRPPSNACFLYYQSMPSVVGTNSDAFGQLYGPYSNGLMTSAKWMNGAAPADWFSFNVSRETATGRVTFSRDTAQVQTDYTYDALGRLTRIAPPSPEIPTVISYDSLTQTTVSRGGGVGLTIWQQYLYDGLGRLLREIRLMPGNTYAVRSTAYDSASQAWFGSEWTACSSSAACATAGTPFGTTSSAFDTFGRATSVRQADGATISVSFSDGPSATKTVTVNNINGNCADGACTGGSSAVTVYTSDMLGRLRSVQEPGGDPPTIYTYDANDELRSVSQGGGAQTRAFEYDPFGFLRSETIPEKGTVVSNSIGSLGNIITQTLSDGIVVNRSYDFAGRLLSITEGSRTYLQNIYNNATVGNSQGKLVSRTATNVAVSPSPTVTDSYVYGELGGRLSQRRTQISGSSSLDKTQIWKYNNLGLIAHHYHPQTPNAAARFVVSTVYDAGLPVAEYVNGIPAVTLVGYRPSGALSSYKTGIFSGKRTVTDIAEDPLTLPRPARISARPEGIFTPIFDTQSYGYDGAGNIVSMGVANDSFSYDLRSRLTLATLAGIGTQAYSYDLYGNLLAKGGTTFCVTTCPSNRISGATYVRGNLTNYGGQSFAYDGLDRMISNQASLLFSYIYDGGDERIAKVPPSEPWTFTLRDESNRVVSEFWGLVPSRDNVFLGNHLVASYADAAVGGSGPPWVFYASDHLGTPRLLTDVTGATLGNRKYWPYGEAIPPQSTYQALRFATMELDAEGGPGVASDRYYDHARSHVGGLGRFLSPDQLGGTPRDPQSWNRYTYARSNPVKLVDPNGLCSAPAGVGNGNVGVCIEAFIAAKRIAGGLFPGDARTFSGTDPDLTSRVQIQFLVNTQTGKVTPATVTTGTSYFLFKSPVTGAEGMTVANVASVPTGNNTTSVSVSATAWNGFTGLPGAPPPIQFNVGLDVSANGTVTADQSATQAKAFPSLAGYAYGPDGGVKTLFKQPENKISDLNKPMQQLKPQSYGCADEGRAGPCP